MPLEPVVSRIAVCGDLWSALTRPAPAATPAACPRRRRPCRRPHSMPPTLQHRLRIGAGFRSRAIQRSRPGTGPGPRPGSRQPAPDSRSPDHRVDLAPRWRSMHRYLLRTAGAAPAEHGAATPGSTCTLVGSCTAIIRVRRPAAGASSGARSGAGDRRFSDGISPLATCSAATDDAVWSSVLSEDTTARSR
jgi:hypothetical protein